jgi:hypothetical protein
MNHGQDPASGAPHRRRGFAWLLGVVLVALIGSLLGGAVILIDAWQRSYVDLTTTVQANVVHPSDTGTRPTR